MSHELHPRGDILQAFADGELADAAAAGIRDHCAACAACRAELGEILALRAALAAEPGPGRPRPVWPALAIRLERERRPLGLGLALGATAACAAGIALGILVGDGRSGGSQEADRTPGGAVDLLWQGGGGGGLLGIFEAAGTEGS